jgi:BCCT family betaine/carnitine transporter
MKKDRTKNVAKLVDKRILIPSVIFIIIISIPFSLYESESLDLLNNIFDAIVTNFGWGYIWYANLLAILGLYMAFSKYGKVVLGKPDEKPDFTLFQYACLLIAMGLGSTIMRTGMIQWMEVANSPGPGYEAGSAEAILMGNSYSMFIWSLQTFSIFVMAAPAIAYVVHVKKRPMMRISEVCRTLFGDKFADGIGGILVDILFLVSILSGAAVTLGLGTPIITESIAYLLNTEVTFTMTMIVTIIWVILFSISAYAGIKKGIKRLSTLNVYLAGIFALFILVVGPGLFVMDFFTDSIGHLVSNYMTFSFYSDSTVLGQTTFIKNHLVFWFAYNATWAMLHSVFAARISKGRTVKEMILTYLLAPTALSWIATGILGGIGARLQLTGEMDVLSLASENDPVSIIPEILSTLPMSSIIIVMFIIIAMIFLTTTLDSTTFTVAAYTSTNDMSQEDPSRMVRILVALIITVLALALMSIGGLEPLEVISGLMGIPIIALQFITIYAAKRMMDKDKAWKYNIRREDNN